MVLENLETEKLTSCGRPKNDNYYNYDNWQDVIDGKGSPVWDPNDTIENNIRNTGKGHIGFIPKCGKDCPAGYKELSNYKYVFKTKNDYYSGCVAGTRKLCGRDWKLSDKQRFNCCTLTGINDEDKIRCEPRFTCALDRVKDNSDCMKIVEKTCENASDTDDPRCLEVCMQDGHKEGPTCRKWWNNYCKKRGSDGTHNMFKDECREYCINHREYCRDNLLSICDSYPLTDIVDDPEKSRVCGCFLPDDIYKTYYNDLINKLRVPEGGIPYYPECFFKDCANAAIKAREPQKCPDIVSCVSNQTLTHNGNINNIIFYNTQECGRYAVSCDSNTECLNNEMCDNGTCRLVCINDAQCGSDMVCNSGKCGRECKSPCKTDESCVSGLCIPNKPDPTNPPLIDWSKYNYLYIFAGIMGIVILYSLYESHANLPWHLMAGGAFSILTILGIIIALQKFSFVTNSPITYVIALVCIMMLVLIYNFFKVKT
jgi:hypothetical protein